MQKTINISGKEVALRSSAATSIRYTQIFHEEFFDAIKILTDGENSTAGIPVVQKLAYVMAAQAGGEDMNALNSEKFAEWLDGFEFNDFADALGDVVEVFMGSSKGNISPK